MGNEQCSECYCVDHTIRKDHRGRDLSVYSCRLNPVHHQVGGDHWCSNWKDSPVGVAFPSFIDEPTE